MGYENEQKVLKRRNKNDVSTFTAIRKMQIQTTLGFHLTLVKKANINK